MASKIYANPAAALVGVLFDGMTIMCGKFWLAGNSEILIPGIPAAGVKNRQQTTDRQADNARAGNCLMSRTHGNPVITP